jgi:exopolysaccharide production protein ExoZ
VCYFRNGLLILARFKSRLANLFELQGGRSRLPSMEGMRGISALLVFFVHFYASFGSRALFSPTVNGAFVFASSFGHCGVDVFFALSGFIIYGMLIEKPVKYLDFVRRRIARLYPAFTAIFVLYVLMNFYYHVKALPSSFLGAVGYLLANFLMLPGLFPITPLITVAWSLSYELGFYLTLPLVVRGLRLAAWPNSAQIAFVLTISGVHLWLCSLGIFGHPRLVMFGCGILLRQTIRYRFKWMPAGNFMALAAFIGALALYGLQGRTAWTLYCGPLLTHSTIRLVALFVAIYALSYFALSDDGFLSKCFSWDWIRWFGNISYSYYLVHGLVLNCLQVALDLLGLPKYLSPPSFLALSGLSFATTVLGGVAIFLAIEKPFSLQKHSAAPVPARQEAPSVPPPSENIRSQAAVADD